MHVDDDDVDDDMVMATTNKQQTRNERGLLAYRNWSQHDSGFVVVGMVAAITRTSPECLLLHGSFHVVCIERDCSLLLSFLFSGCHGGGWPVFMLV